MNSIKSNPFLSALAGITLVICAALFYLASKGGGKKTESVILHTLRVSKETREQDHGLAR